MKQSQPGQSPATPDDPQAALALARHLVDGRQCVEALQVYRQHARTLPPGSAAWADHCIGLAATLCLVAQDQVVESIALLQLDESRGLLSEVLRQVSQADAPHRWASARANLASVLLCRSVFTASISDVVSAHLALDGTEAVFASLADADGVDWVRALRDQCVEQRERRAAAR